MHTHRISGAISAGVLFSAIANAQTSFPEVEPNSLKSEATLVNGITANDSITGSCTGSTALLGDSSAISVDTFRVKTAALPLGIYRHQLTLTSATAGHSATLRGLIQNVGVIGTLDVGFQFSSTTTSPANANVWYGFGKQEEIYYRVQGTAATTAAYAATLVTTPVTAQIAAGTFNAGPITVACVVGQTTDTEIYVYDGNLNPVPLGHNDDPFPQVTFGPSSITVPLAGGTYYVAISNFNTSNNVSDAHPQENYQSDNLLDFPDAMANSSTTTALPVSFTVSDGTTTSTVVATKSSFFGIEWGRFTVTGTLPPPANDNCASATALTGALNAGYLGSATNDGAASCDPGGAASKDVWFSTSGGLYGGQLTLTTCGSGGVDTVLSVYASCGGTELACNDDCGGSPCGGPTSCVSLALGVNQNVLIRVSDKGLGGNTFFLNRVFTPNPPTNDSCTNPVVLPAPGNYPIDTTNATTGTEGQAENACLFFGATAVNKDLWYRYTATLAGTITVTTCGLLAGGPSQDSKIAAYAASACPVAGSAIACNDDFTCTGFSGFNATISFPTTCGQDYMIQIGYYGNGPTGIIVGQFSLTETGTACSTPSTPFCDGSSAGTTCLGCGNNGVAGRGCANSAFASGTLLSSTGIASIASDTLVLNATDIPGPGLYFQANGLIAPTTFGDGMLCAGVGIIRMGVVFPTPTFTSSYPGGLTPNPIHIAGGPISAGDLKHYQVWYRDAVVFCTTSTFNTTNGISLTWAP